MRSDLDNDSDKLAQAARGTIGKAININPDRTGAAQTGPAPLQGDMRSYPAVMQGRGYGRIGHRMRSSRRR